MTVEDTNPTKYLQCEYLSPVEGDALGVTRPCRYPTTRVNRVELDPTQPPELQTTVIPICYFHEIGLAAEELSNDD